MTLPPKRLAAEAVPVAGILAFWNLLAHVVQIQNVGGPVRTAGVVMAGLYVVVRGVALAPDVPRFATDDVRVVLYENARVAVPAGAWFVAAMAVAALDASTGYGHSPLTTVVASALAGAGLGVVGIYAVAAGYRTLGEGSLGGGDAGSTGDDRPADGASADD
ncbi:MULTISPECIES: hypothetical protein [Halorussus]|uniref:hypothetical protein n=1 Tax=Halorussus TaxID=1070314 RepID=UPI000E215010|nr:MULTISPECIES: hypothetical protein [Halorussus]NHN61536.1 hypothetical protein [Halorussus sp. JP-T4]